MALTTKGTKNKKIAATENAATLEAVKELELTKVIGEVGTLQVAIQNSLANLSTSLTSKIQQLETIDSAIDLKQERLRELHQIEQEALSIDELRAIREEESREWQKKKADRDAQWAEELTERDKLRKREVEEYLYNTKLNQKKIRDEFETEVAKAKREEQIRQELLNREWEQREAELAGRETELDNLREQVQGFDARLKSEIAKAEAIVGNAIKRQYEHEIALIKKDAEVAGKMHEAHEDMLQQNIASLQTQIHDLQAQLVAARADAKEVASQALQSASGRQVVEALQRAQEVQSVLNKTK